MTSDTSGYVNFHDLPAPSQLQACLQSMAMLDAILSQGHGEPVHAYSQKWTRHQSVVIVNDGQGNDLFFVFEKSGCFAKGCVHDIPLSRDGERHDRLAALIPHDCRRHFREPAFQCCDATVFAWYANEDSGWHSTTEAQPDVDDGSRDLLGLILLEPEKYQQWAEENYEVNVSLEFVTRVFERVPLSASMLLAFNSGLKIAGIREEAAKIGYPFV